MEANDVGPVLNRSSTELMLWYGPVLTGSVSTHKTSLFNGMTALNGNLHIKVVVPVNFPCSPLSTARSKHSLSDNAGDSAVIDAEFDITSFL